MNELRAQVMADFDNALPEQAFDRLAAVLRDPGSDVAAKWFAHRFLPQVIERMPGSAFGQERRAAAARCHLSVPEARDVFGKMAFPAIGGGRSRFVALRVSGTRDAEDQLPAWLSGETQEAMRQAIAVARIRSGQPDHRFLVTLDATDEPLSGRSFGLALALALLSFTSRRPISDAYLATGALSGDSTVRAVGHLKEKLALLRSSRPEGVLLVPASMEHAVSDVRVRAVSTLDEAMDLVCVSARHDPVDQIGLARTDFECGRWPKAAARALALIEDDCLRDEERVMLLTILLAAKNHGGEQRQAAGWSQRLRPLLADPTLPPRRTAEALAHLAIQAVDLLRPDEASAVLQQAAALRLSEQDEGMLHLRGAESRVAILRGDLGLARDLRDRNAWQSVRWSDERPRCLLDLADVLLRLELPSQALAALREARAALDNSRRRPEYLQITAMYLRLEEARVCRALGDRAQALGHLELAGNDPRGPLLQLALERALLTENPLAQVLEIEQGWQGLPGRGEVIFQALLLRARLEAGDEGALASLAVLLGGVEDDARSLCRRLPY